MLQMLYLICAVFSTCILVFVLWTRHQARTKLDQHYSMHTLTPGRLPKDSPTRKRLEATSATFERGWQVRAVRSAVPSRRACTQTNSNAACIHHPTHTHTHCQQQHKVPAHMASPHALRRRLPLRTPTPASGSSRWRWRWMRWRALGSTNTT